MTWRYINESIFVLSAIRIEQIFRQKDETRPEQKVEGGLKYNIEAVRPNGEPLAPKKIADKFIRQCGVLVKDQLPISLQEWREPAKDKRQKGKGDAAPRPDVTFVDKNQKDLLWDTLMEHFILPDHFTEADV